MVRFREDPESKAVLWGKQTIPPRTASIRNLSVTALRSNDIGEGLRVLPSIAVGIGDEAPWAPESRRATEAYQSIWTTHACLRAAGFQSHEAIWLLVQYCTRLAQGCGPVPAYKIKNARPNLALISSLSPVRGRQTDPLRSGERLQRRLSPGKASLPYFGSETGKPSPLRRPRPGLLTWARGGGVGLLMPGVQYCTRLAGPESQPQYARPDLVPVSSLPPVHGGVADLMPSGERCRR